MIVRHVTRRIAAVEFVQQRGIACRSCRGNSGTVPCPMSTDPSGRTETKTMSQRVSSMRYQTASGIIALASGIVPVAGGHDRVAEDSAC